MGFLAHLVSAPAVKKRLYGDTLVYIGYSQDALSGPAPDCTRGEYLHDPYTSSRWRMHDFMAYIGNEVVAAC